MKEKIVQLKAPPCQPIPEDIRYHADKDEGKDEMALKEHKGRTNISISVCSYEAV